MIDCILEMINSMLKLNTSRIIKFKLLRSLIQNKQICKDESIYNKEEELKEIGIFHYVIIANLERDLSDGREFVCGNQCTLADIAYYNELVTTLAVIDERLDD